MAKLLQGQCHICGNVSGYDEISLAGSTWKINGASIILCCPCEDDLLKQIALAHSLKINFSKETSGEIESITIIDSSIKVRRQ